MKIRSGNACLAIVAFLIFSGCVVPPALALDRTLEGQVTGPGGAGVADATVFVTFLGRAGRPPEMRAGLRTGGDPDGTPDRVVKSAPDGTFNVLLPVGRYRVTVIRAGYEVALAEVNLLAHKLLEVRLNPEGAAPVERPDGVTARDRGLDWILRRSDRDVLRDLEEGVPGPIDRAVLVSAREGKGAGSAAQGMRLPPVDGEFRQDFSGSSLWGGGSSGPGDASGRSTRLALRGGVGEQGSWRFDGLSGRTSAASAGGEETRAGRTRTGLGVAIDARLGPNDGLKSEVHYATSRYLFEPGVAADGIEQEQRSAALRARWDRKLGDAAGVYVAGSYLDAAVRQPATGSLLFESPAPGEGDGDRLTDRSVGADTGLALRADDHAIGLGLRVHSYRYDLGDGGALLTGTDTDPVTLEAGRQGSSMSLFGGDDWRVADGYVLNYGLGYHNDLTSGNAYVVPRVGVTTTLPEAGDLRVRSAVMVRLDDGRPSPVGAPGAEWPDGERQGTRLGYEIGVERRSEDRLQFAATLSYRPFQEIIGGNTVTAPAGLPEEGVLVLADAAAGRHEMTIEMERGFGTVRGILEGSVGRVQGRLGRILGEGPLVEPQAGQARYCLTALRAMIEPTDTEVRIDYRRIIGETGEAEVGEPGPVDYRRLDLAVFQDLPFSPFAASRFRVLMAYQGLLFDSVDGSQTLLGSSAGSRLTGGVDISF